MDRKDGEWITIGGMITAAKKIRARSGLDADVRHRSTTSRARSS